jgi:type IV pilus assembly protein PilN
MILAVFLWQTFNNQKNQETEFQQSIEAAKREQVNSKNQKTELRQAIEARTGELVNLLVGNMPVSVILDDINKRTPITVRVDAITQTSAVATAQSPATSTISLSGKATSYNELNDFLLLLKGSRLLKEKETFLLSTTLQPATADSNFTLVNFQIQVVVTSPTEALPHLQKMGADGLVTRINLLKQQGVILANKSNIAQTIERAKQQNIFVLSLLPNVDNIDTLMRDIQDQIPKTITLRTFQATLERDTINERTQIPKTITLRTFQPTAPVKGYDTYSFTIGFDSKFEDILNAIQKIERLKPLLVIKDLTLTNQKTQSPTLMSADFTLQVFVPKN